ncbi:MAG TPA: CBS domain-containing protein [Desulfobacteraceae bacterium]|nr:CBS domain-containing protein [Deltaproteobacteria bacterium]MBW2356379.1 CBS domain-containing protein [Deltaproteobacteria bacterium]RLB99273.1 MAG: signal transduction protein [Deltaproteobacteria bacterium]HDI59260.1 CBS domain-containing protein [Desulfobacteraceae bacterium]
MKISALMIPDPITITDTASIQDAIEVMKTNSIRHLPVIDAHQRLRGLVTLADLKQGLIPSMIGDLGLADLMIRDPICVSPDDDVELAAQVIYKHKISGMPVIQGGKLVGIITESDILRAFIDMMGILTSSSRLDVALDDSPEAFHKVLQRINTHGGDVINVGLVPRAGGKKRVYYFRLSTCKTAPIRRALEKEGYQVLEAMD